MSCGKIINKEIKKLIKFKFLSFLPFLSFLFFPLQNRISRRQHGGSGELAGWLARVRNKAFFSRELGGLCTGIGQRGLTHACVVG